jgi:predicted DNA-binding transcriptional regulator AlpA
LLFIPARQQQTERDMSLIEPETTSQLLPTRLVCKRYGVADRTIARWERDAELGFPQPVTINGRKYYAESALTTFDRTQAARR